MRSYRKHSRENCYVSADPRVSYHGLSLAGAVQVVWPILVCLDLLCIDG